MKYTVQASIKIILDDKLRKYIDSDERQQIANSIMKVLQSPLDELETAKKRLKDLEKILNDPDQLAEYIGGI